MPAAPRSDRPSPPFLGPATSRARRTGSNRGNAPTGPPQTPRTGGGAHGAVPGGACGGGVGVGPAANGKPECRPLGAHTFSLSSCPRVHDRSVISCVVTYLSADSHSLISDVRIFGRLLSRGGRARRVGVPLADLLFPCVLNFHVQQSRPPAARQATRNAYPKCASVFSRGKRVTWAPRRESRRGARDE